MTMLQAFQPVLLSISALVLMVSGCDAPDDRTTEPSPPSELADYCEPVDQQESGDAESYWCEEEDYAAFVEAAAEVEEFRSTCTFTTFAPSSCDWQQKTQNSIQRCAAGTNLWCKPGSYPFRGEVCTCSLFKPTW